MSLNFFAEKHGKSNRDTHFSNISKFVEAESLIKKLTCSEDISSAITERQKLANENSKSILFDFYGINLRLLYFVLLCRTANN